MTNKNVVGKPNLRLKNNKHTMIYLLLIIAVIFFNIYFKQKNKKEFDFIIINQLIYKEQNRFIIPYVGSKTYKKGFFFIGKNSEFYDLNQKKSNSVKELDNSIPVYATLLDNIIVILNKKNNILELIKYDVNTQKILNKRMQIYFIEKDVNIGSPFLNLNRKNIVYIPIFSKNGKNQIIVLYENFEKYKIIENNLENIEGTIVQPEGLHHFMNIGGYNKNTKIYSNAIYTTFDFKTEKLFLETQIDEKSKYFFVNYSGIPDKLTGSYNAQEIWIINNRKLIKIDIFTNTIKQEKLPIEFENCKILKVLKLYNKQICFIEKKNKIYYFEINYKKRISPKYLIDNFSGNISFTTLPFNSKNKNVYVFVK